MDSSWRRRPRLPWCKAGGLQTCVTFPGNATARRGTQPGPNPFTARLDTWKLSKNLSSQSCQHVYCMTILQEEFRCFVNFELFEHCVCVTEQCPTLPQPPTTPHSTDFLSQESTQSPGPLPSTIFDCQIFQMPFETCEVIYFKNGCCGDCVWYYCSYLSF